MKSLSVGDIFFFHRKESYPSSPSSLGHFSGYYIFSEFWAKHDHMIATVLSVNVCDNVSWYNLLLSPGIKIVSATTTYDTGECATFIAIAHRDYWYVKTLIRDLIEARES